MRRDPIDFRDTLIRYLLSFPYCSKLNVVDLGSKSGYGAHLVGYMAQSMTLVDRSSKMLAKARKYYHWLCPTEFIVQDFNESYPVEVFDTALAFEIIEHVDDPDLFVKNISEHVNKYLVFSVPHMLPNAEHKTLFDEKKIKDLISKYFKIIEFQTQQDGKSYWGAGKKYE